MELDEILAGFDFFTDWVEKYRYLIDLGRQLPELEEAHRVEANKVVGCQSQVWLIAEAQDDGRLVFVADSDAAIVKGLIAIVLAVYSGKQPEEIVKTKVEEVFSGIGLDQHLSPNRRNGFFAMVTRIKRLAVEAVMRRA